MAPDVIRRKQVALERERVKLYFPAVPGRKDSALGQIVIENILKYAQNQLL